MFKIKEMVTEFINETGEAHLETRAGVEGVVFHDEGEFIPLNDLAYNDELGFFQVSAIGGWMTVTEAAVKFGVKADTIRKALQRGEIRDARKETTIAGGRKEWRFAEVSFRQWAENRPKRGTKPLAVINVANGIATVGRMEVSGNSGFRFVAANNADELAEKAAKAVEKQGGGLNISGQYKCPIKLAKKAVFGG